MEMCSRCGAKTKFGELVEEWRKSEHWEIFWGWIMIILGVALALSYIGTLVGIPSIGIGLFCIYSSRKKIEKKKIAYLKSLVGQYEYIDRGD